jgi:hypothetical protein
VKSIVIWALLAVYLCVIAGGAALSVSAIMGVNPEPLFWASLIGICVNQFIGLLLESKA